MKSLIAVAGMLSVLLFSGNAFAAVHVNNKFCPVSGEKVGQMGDIVTYEYKGKIYNLCCPMCIKDFKRNPAKYSKIAEDSVKLQMSGKDDETTGDMNDMDADDTGEMHGTQGMHHEEHDHGNH